MSLPDSIDIRDRSLQVYLGGPGFGEGVFIVIGKTIGIGIDCCSSFVQDRHGDGSFIDRQIRQIPPDGILLWVLTHYHWDHFRWLYSLLQRVSTKINAMAFPLDYNSEDFSFLIEQREELGNSPTKLALAKREFVDLRNLLTLPPFTKTTRVTGVNHWVPLDLSIGKNEAIPLRVKICGPPTDVYDKHVANSVKKIKDEQCPSRQHANRGSYIVHCRIGSFEGLFLGDAGTERVDQLLSECVIGDHGIDCLKVGHHGSDDGTNEELLNLCARPAGNKKEQHALIAPYAPKLPKDETIKLLEDFGYRVHISKHTHADKSMDEQLAADALCATNVGVIERNPADADIVGLNFEF
jgi:hypothetical protein